MYIVGHITPAERIELEARGWEVEEIPAEVREYFKGHGLYVRAWVDSDVFQVMSGLGWDTAHVEPDTATRK